MSVQAISVQGMLLQVGNGSSPETFATIANISDVTLPFSAKEVDVSNVSSIWSSMITTIKSIGKISMTVFFVPTDPTQDGSSPYGLLYLFQLSPPQSRDFQLIFNDGASSTFAWQAYVSQCEVSGKVGDVFTMKVTLLGTGQPSLAAG